MFMKMVIEVKIQKTQSGTVQKVPNMFEMLVSPTSNFSTNM